MAFILANGKQQYFDNSGNPLVGGRLFTMEPGPGVTTPKSTWTDAGETALNTNPIILDARGEAQVFWSGSYNVRVETATGGLIYTVESIVGGDDALRADLANTSNAARGDALIGVQLAGISTVPRTQHAKNAEVISVKDYGAVGDGITDDTAAITAALTAVHLLPTGGELYFPAGIYGVTTVVYAWPTAGDNVTVNIRGAGQRATVIKKLGSSTTPVFNFSSTPALNNGVYSEFANFCIQGNNLCPGIQVTQFARWVTRNLLVTDCTVGMDAVGTLICDFYSQILQENQIGFRCRQSGGIYPNLISFWGGGLFVNSTTGADIGEAQNVAFNATDIEINGTAANPATAGVIIRSTCGLVGEHSTISFNGAWVEGNLGNGGIVVENATFLSLVLRDVPFNQNEAGRSLTCGSIRSLYIENCCNNVSGSFYEIGACQNTVIRGGSANTVNDSSINFIYEGVQIGGVSVPYRSGGSLKPTYTRNAGVSNSGLGNVASTSGVALSLITASGPVPRLYEVFVCLGGLGANYTATGRFVWDAANLVRTGGDNAANMTLTASGANIQATQTSGSAQTIFYAVNITG
jgi:Pectate lyase superfamily protein